MEFKLDQALEVLTGTPAVLNALLRGRSEGWLTSRVSPESFSPIDVVGHLTLADRTNWIPRAELILSGDGTRTFEPFDRFAFQPLIEGKTADALLDEFAATRKQSLLTLRDLGIGFRELEMRGKHPEFGEVSLSQLLATWVVHDLGHTSQIVKAMSSAYRDAVGSWRAYLTILN
jgi:hypothetical protein